jgi:hypothetical protein
VLSDVVQDLNQNNDSQDQHGVGDENEDAFEVDNLVDEENVKNVIEVVGNMDVKYKGDNVVVQDLSQNMDILLAIPIQDEDVNVASFNVEIYPPNKDNVNVDGPSSGSDKFVGSHDKDVVEGRRLSDRKEITLYCDEDQLASLLLNHYSFPKSICSEMVEIVESDQEVDDCNEQETRYKTRKYISPCKSQMMHESAKRFSSSSINSTSRVHGEDMETIQTIMHEYFLEEPPKDVCADHTIIWWGNCDSIHRTYLLCVSISLW